MMYPLPQGDRYTDLTDLLSVRRLDSPRPYSALETELELCSDLGSGRVKLPLLF